MQFRRSILALIVSLATESALAEEVIPAAKPRGANEPAQQLTISPRAIEEPTLKYRLFPAEFELQEGNAAPILLRLPWEQTAYFSKEVPDFGGYLDIPLNSPKLRGKEIFAFYDQLKRAAYRKTADWQYPIGEKPLAQIVLPDLQGGRRVAGDGLCVWIRQRLAERDLARAREGVLVGFAVVRHYGRTPFVITQNVCVAVDSMLLSRVAELVSQPDSPNLYWALTQLPRPLVDFRPSIELQERFLQGTVPGIEDLSQIKTEQEWDRGALGVLRFFREMDTGGRLGANAKPRVLERPVARARAELSRSFEGGATRVAAMSDGEAVLRWLLEVYNDQSQETTALMSLEPPIAIPRLIDLQKRITEFQSALGNRDLFLFSRILNTYVAGHKLEREIDALRIIEAIRDYAAVHDSQLPESLAKIVDVPIPNDPFTGKPFHYEVTDGVASISAEGISVPQREGPMAAIHYQLRIRK
jgi:hypothetical protein